MREGSYLHWGYWQSFGSKNTAARTGIEQMRTIKFTLLYLGVPIIDCSITIRLVTQVRTLCQPQLCPLLLPPASWSSSSHAFWRYCLSSLTICIIVANRLISRCILSWIFFRMGLSFNLFQTTSPAGHPPHPPDIYYMGSYQYELHVEAPFPLM